MMKRNQPLRVCAAAKRLRSRRRNLPRQAARRGRSGPAVAAGFTLVELLISVALVSVIMTALGSVVVVASRALPTSPTGTPGDVGAALAVEQMTEELRFARSIVEVGPTHIEFTVADRTGDGQGETIRYEWDGPGEPLMRAWNDDAPVTVLDSLHDFSLEYVRRSHTKTDTTTTLVTTDVVLSSFTGWAGITPNMIVRDITSLDWVSQKFVIDDGVIPPDAVAWRITDIDVRLRRKGSLGSAAELRVYHPASPGGFLIGPEPIGTPAVIPSSEQTTSWGWRRATFDDVEFTDPTVRELIFLVRAPLLYLSDTSELLYFSATNAPNTSDYIMQWTTDGGLTWNPSNNRHRNRVPYYVHGSVDTVEEVTTTQTRYTMRQVTISVQMGERLATRIVSAVQTLNEPEAPAP